MRAESEAGLRALHRDWAKPLWGFAVGGAFAAVWFSPAVSAWAHPGIASDPVVSTTALASLSFGAALLLGACRAAERSLGGVADEAAALADWWRRYRRAALGAHVLALSGYFAAGYAFCWAHTVPTGQEVPPPLQAVGWVVAVAVTVGGAHSLRQHWREVGAAASGAGRDSGKA